MSTSLFYSVRKDAPFTSTEIAALNDAVAKSNADQDFDSESIGFSNAPDETSTELDGSTKVSGEFEEIFVALRFYLASLTALRAAVPDAEWTVQLDELPVPWTAENRYTLEGLDDEELTAGL